VDDGRSPTDAELDLAVRELTVLAHASQWDRVLAIGKLILSRFFGKDEAAWHARRRNKDQSIRRLARHPDCPFEKSALTEAVGVYVLVGRFPELRERIHLTPTHVGRALSLKPTEAVALLKIADQRRWSVRELAFEAKQLRRAMGERRGRPLSSSDRKAERSGRHTLRLLGRMRLQLSSMTSIEPTSRARLVSLCGALEQELEAVRALLHPERQLAANDRASPVKAPPPGRDPLQSVA